jgi:hypothetical protein
VVNQGSVQPTVDERWPDDVDVVMFVDESGTVPHHRILRADDERWVTLAGVEFTKADYFKRLIPALTTFKAHWWPPNGEYWYVGPRFPQPELRRVVLHWSDVRNHRGPFSSKTLRASPDQFRQALRDLLDAMPCRIRAVTLDITAWRDIADLCAGILRYQHRSNQRTTEWNIIQPKFATRRGEILIPE